LRRAVTFKWAGYTAMKRAAMAVVIKGGTVRAGDVIKIQEGSRWVPLRPV
jgi:MOSC domain-containing protein YiiM